MVSFDFITDLRDKNHRIKEINDEIERYGNNKLHLQMLEDECIEAQQKLNILSKQWETEYIPAMDRRQKLQNELETAKTHPEQFQCLVDETLKCTSLTDVETLIEETQNRSTWTVIDLTLNPSQEAGPSGKDLNRNDKLNIKRGSLHRHHRKDSSMTTMSLSIDEDSEANTTTETYSSIYSTSSAGSATVERGSIKRESGDFRKLKRRSWSVTSADQKLEILEKIHAEISGKKRSLGNKTCEMAATLRSLQEQTASLEIAMSMPAHLLYSSLEHELRPYKLKCYQAYVAERKTHGSPASNKSRASNKLSSQEPAMRNEISSVSDTRTTDLTTVASTSVMPTAIQSEDTTVTSLNDVSIVTSLADLSQFGTDILKGF